MFYVAIMFANLCWLAKTVGVFLIDLTLRTLMISGITVLYAMIFAAYLRLKNRKLLFISTGFGVFWVLSFLLVAELFVPWLSLNDDLRMLGNLIALAFILFGILKDL